jgi:phenylalanyl-tRNA synthetase beta chain
MRGLEVESIEEQTPSFDRVVIGKILKIDKHPHAQNLLICNVDIGRDTFPIVCGAKNFKNGDKVPVALAGAQLADGVTIERKDIKGIESIGMLCSEKELGLSDDHSGIFILPDSLKVGDELKEAPWIKDVVLDINVAPNRGDLLSIYGIAREVGSIFNQKVTVPSFRLEGGRKEDIKEYLKLEVLIKMLVHDTC